MSKCMKCIHKDSGFNCLHSCHGGDAFVPRYKDLPKQKMIIELPEELIDRLFHGGEKSIHDYPTIMKAIMQGTLLSQNTTNGNVIKAMFPNIKVEYIRKLSGVNYYRVSGMNDFGFQMDFYEDWWNAPYKTIDKE